MTEEKKPKTATERKREQRAREKEAKAAAALAAEVEKETTELGSLKTAEDYWAKIRATLSPEELKDRQDLDLSACLAHEAIQQSLAGTSTEDLDELIVEVRDWYKDGLVDTNVTVVPRFWLNKEFLAGLNEQTAAYAKYGLLTRLPASRAVYEFIQRHAPQLYWPDNYIPSIQETTEYVTMTCEGCPPERRLASRRSISKFVTNMYAEKNIPYRCHDCIAGNVAVKVKQQPVVGYETVTDAWGRIKSGEPQ
jgi:hypothetical protein